MDQEKVVGCKKNSRTKFWISLCVYFPLKCKTCLNSLTKTMYRDGRRRPKFKPVGQVSAGPVIIRNNFLGWAFVGIAALAILIAVGFIIANFSLILKIETRTNDIPTDPCPVPCPDPCPNVTLSCPDPPDPPEFEESDLCDDWDNCTLDLLATFPDNSTRACKHLVRENGFPCESPCFVTPPNATANTTCQKGKCVGEECLGTCEEPPDCPVLNQTIFESVECIDGSCLYTKILVPGGPLLDCSADVFQRSCDCAIEDEPLRDCLIADVVCGELFVRKRQPNGNWFVLCTYSFFCALPKTIPLFFP